MNKLFSMNVFFISLLISLLGSNEILKNNISENKIEKKSAPDLFSESNQWTENKLNSMTLREKIAQMIITNSFGYALDNNSAEYKRLSNLIVNEKVGGVIFFKGNSVQQAELTNSLQSLSETPLLISADYERGTKMRLDDGSLFPSNMALGATRNPELAYLMGIQIAKECRSIGVHQNYAPVVDVNNNSLNPIINVRSYGEDPSLVSSMSEKFIKGLQEGNVIATAKHFPGHGDTDIDSHSDLPVLNFSRERLDNLELIPFKNAIKNNVMSVMIAHLSLPSLDAEANVPASLSKNIVEGLLINELKFNGLIVTDALNMAGVVNHFSVREVALRCVNAGIDLILMPQGETEAIDAIENAVNNGSISEERINLSAKKILNAKSWLKLDENKLSDVSKVSSIVNSDESMKISQQIADESITLVKNSYNILPFTMASEMSCLIVSMNNGNEKANSDFFLSKFNEENKFKSTSFFDLTGDVINSNEILSEASSYDVVIVPVYAKVKIKTGTVGLPQSQLDLINSLISNGKKVVVVSFGNPYLIQGFPEVGSYICAYADAETSINSVIKSFYGTIKYKGKLPVSISNEFKYGDGITN
ncbi:MAG: glycoside hydrolase family 3 C-terminal domain-containing protein [Ignavibacteria bacterium]|nr:glycoside hydrolase family 3 C-terminal domain-containing protein [Ignavibacteria bacterium]MBK9405556.1 glycoside hydrolase family 3 C-terminal domain-containing protein [Ignavibacteria bacterium]